jgi:dipeptidyl aminopeptidase/acylaminoacyl peptidase
MHKHGALRYRWAMRKIRRAAALGGFALLSLCFAGAALAAPKRIPTHEDIWLMKRLGAPQVSPDGRRLVVPVVEPSYDENMQLSDLWLVDTAARHNTRRLTSTRRPEAGVTWSPDSRRIAFAAQRDSDDVPQVYSLDLDAGGEAQRLTHLSGGARNPVYSHDGRHLAYLSVMFPDARDDAANKQMLEARRTRKASVRVFDGFPIRSWDRWLDERQIRIFVQPLDADGMPAGPARDVLLGSKLLSSPGFAGRQTDTGEELDIEFTPDNRAIVFAATTNRNAAAYSFTDSELFVVDVAGGEPRRITKGQHSWSRPRFTPDGRTLLALVDGQDGKNVYNQTRIAALPWPYAGEPRIVTHDLDRPVGTYAVSPDSRTVYFTAEDSGHEKLYSVRTGGGKVRVVANADVGTYANITIPARATDTAIYSNWESAGSPGEISLISPNSARSLALTKFNAARASSLDLPRLESFWFTSSRGKRIHSFVVRPPGFDASKKYPLFVLIHGGPHAMWRDQFFIRWNYHLLAARGYVLLLTNYSGSTGFGEEFGRSIQGDPLKGPADEINEAADAAIARFGFIDGTRQCAGGASYGGHLSNWLQASTTRYKCLVSHAGLVNLESQWGTSDTIYGREVNMGGPPWDQAPVWREQNPIRFAAKFRTPVLVTIGENDYRVPLNNTLEYWSALQRMQVPSRLLVFPDENHWILKGENSRFFYDEVGGWLDRWLAPAH